MNDKIKTISIAVIAGVVLIGVGWYIAAQFFTLQGSLNQVVNYLNNQIQAKAMPVPATK